MWRIIDTMQEFIDRQTGVRSIMCEIAADTAEDLPANSADRVFILGTFATAIDTGDIYKINSAGAWILQPSQNAFSNVYTKSESDYLFEWITATITTDALPLTFKADGSPLISWSMKGNGQQTGTPTPDNPVMPEFVGVRTAQIFDKNATNTSNGYITDGYIRSDGTKNTNSDYRASEYTEIIPETEYTLNYGSQLNAPAICFYTAAKEYISGIAYNGNMTIHFTTPQNARFCRLSFSAVDADLVRLNSGSTDLPYKPFGWAIPISCGGETTPVYLGQVQTVRRVKKLVFDGTENFEFDSSDANRTVCNILLKGVSGNYGYCTHIEWKAPYASTEYNRIVWNTLSGGTLYVSIANQYLTGQTLDDFKSYLADQYAAGTPVTIWYVLASETTGIVNEPLCKIGTYADELSSTDAGVAIPTAKGQNTLTVDTPIQPSEMAITGKIRET